jgi:CRP-like cAMP-binding protein
MASPRPTSSSWRSSTGDHSPLVLRRLLALLQSPLLVDIELSELAILAENVVESTFVRGEQVAPGGQCPRSIHHVLEGRIELAAAPARTWTAHTTFGLLEVLSRRPLAAPALAVSDVTTLELDAADLFEILEDHFVLLRRLIRALAARAIELPSRWPPVPPPAPAPDAPMGLVDRMIFIRQYLPLVAARMQPLAILAHAARELTWSPGEVVAHAGASDRDAFIVVEGALAATRDGEETRLYGPRTAFGALEIFAGRPHDHEVTAITHARVLALPANVLLDVLEDCADLALSVAASLAAAILDGAPQGTRGTTAESNS